MYTCVLSCTQSYERLYCIFLHKFEPFSLETEFMKELIICLNCYVSYHKDICNTKISLVTLFNTQRRCGQPYPTVEEWVMNILYICKIENFVQTEKWNHKTCQKIVEYRMYNIVWGHPNLEKEIRTFFSHADSSLSCMHIFFVNKCMCGYRIIFRRENKKR